MRYKLLLIICMLLIPITYSANIYPINTYINKENVTNYYITYNVTSGFSGVDNIYIWNNSNTITFNETKGNLTTKNIVTNANASMKGYVDSICVFNSWTNITYDSEISSLTDNSTIIRAVNATDYLKSSWTNITYDSEISSLTNNATIIRVPNTTWITNNQNYNTSAQMRLTTGWNKSGTNVILNTITNNVGIGTTPDANTILELKAINKSLSLGGTMGITEATGIQFLDYGTAHIGLRYLADGNRNLILESAGNSNNPNLWYDSQTANLLIRNGVLLVNTLTNPWGYTLHVNGAISTNNVMRLQTDYADIRWLEGNGTGFRWALAKSGTFRIQKSVDNFTGITTTPILINSDSSLTVADLAAGTGATDFVCSSTTGLLSNADLCSSIEILPNTGIRLDTNKIQILKIKNELYAEDHPTKANQTRNQFYTVAFEHNNETIIGEMKIPRGLNDDEILYSIKQMVEEYKGKHLLKVDVQSKLINKVYDLNEINLSIHTLP